MKKSGVGGQIFNNAFYPQAEIAVSMAAERPEKTIGRLMKIKCLTKPGMFLDYWAGVDRLLLIPGLLKAEYLFMSVRGKTIGMVFTEQLEKQTFIRLEPKGVLVPVRTVSKL